MDARVKRGHDGIGDPIATASRRDGRSACSAVAARRQWRMTAIQAWLVLLVFYAAPLLHVALSPKSGPLRPPPGSRCRSEEHTSELQSLMRISYAVFCLKKNTNNKSPTA